MKNSELWLTRCDRIRWAHNYQLRELAMGYHLIADLTLLNRSLQYSVDMLIDEEVFKDAGYIEFIRRNMLDTLVRGIKPIIKSVDRYLRKTL